MIILSRILNHWVSPVSDSDTESIDEFSDVLTCIKEWVVECQTPMSTLSSFLEIMRPYFPTLPKDPRTLFRTKTMYDTKELAGGLYYHFGMESGILSRCVDSFLIQNLL